jgi:predicted RNA binding protein YcfA (HicA-like mRNA interferase family)/predicted RNase H-like HicB family nuclease
LKFSEVVRRLEKAGFRIVKEKGSIRYYGKPGWPRVIRIDYHGSKEIPTGTCQSILKAAGLKQERLRGDDMIELPYSLVIEATEEPDYFGFYSPDLEGFTGIGHSVEDCLYKAKWGMKEHVELLKEQNLPVPAENPDPKIVIQNAKNHAAAV